MAITRRNASLAALPCSACGIPGPPGLNRNPLTVFFTRSKLFTASRSQWSDAAARSPRSCASTNLPSRTWSGSKGIQKRVAPPGRDLTVSEPSEQRLEQRDRTQRLDRRAVRGDEAGTQGARDVEAAAE